MSPSANGAAGEETSDRPLGVVEVPWNLVVPEVDVHLVGYGMRLPNDLTLEALAVLQRCKRVFGAPPIYAPEFNVPAMENLLELYSPGKGRIETYNEMAENVLEAAAADPPVAFATYGSPMVGTYAAHRILELAGERELTVHVTNAVSSFDGIFADLNIDPFFGVEIWEATTFLRLGIEPSGRAHLLLPQAPVLGVAEGVDPETLELNASSEIPVLRDHLLRFYAPEHKVHYVTAASFSGPHLLASGVQSLALGELDDPGTSQISTLVVPRAQPARFDFGRPPAAASEGSGR